MTGTEAKAAQVAAKIAAETQQQQSLPTDPSQVGESSPFAQILQKHEESVNSMSGEMMKAFGASNNAHPADNAVSARGLDIDLSAAQKMKDVNSSEWSSVLSELNHQGLQMEKTVEMITMPGQHFNNFELLAIQAQLHQATFKAELFMKIADATKTIPQTMINRYGGN